jgi:hypothetical protein
MKRDKRPLGTWRAVVVILAMGIWTGGLAYAQIGGAHGAPATTTVR